jgi:hypothetical protein
MHRYFFVLLSKLKTVSLSNFTLPAQHPNYRVPSTEHDPLSALAHSPKIPRYTTPTPTIPRIDLRPFLPSPTHLQPSSSHLTSHIISPSCPKTKHFPEGLDGAHLPNPQCLPRSHVQLSPITQFLHPLTTGASPPSFPPIQTNDEPPPPRGAPFIEALTKLEN